MIENETEFDAEDLTELDDVLDSSFFNLNSVLEDFEDEIGITQYQSEDFRHIDEL